MGAVSKSQITIEQKLRLIVITTSLCAVLLVCGFFVLTGIRWNESKLRGELKSTSRLVSTWSAAPLDFQLGWEDATNAVSVLAEYPNITEGLLYCLSDDDAFQAETGFEIAPERPPQLPSLETIEGQFYLCAAYRRGDLPVGAAAWPRFQQFFGNLHDFEEVTSESGDVIGFV